MDAIVLQRAESDHNIAQKLIREKDRVDFDPSSVTVKATKGRYLGGWRLSGIPTMKEILECSPARF